MNPEGQSMLSIFRMCHQFQSAPPRSVQLVRGVDSRDADHGKPELPL